MVAIGTPVLMSYPLRLETWTLICADGCARECIFFWAIMLIGFKLVSKGKN